jgi:biotin carboxyl carrier protein
MELTMKLQRVGQTATREVEITGRRGSAVSARIDGRELEAIVERVADGSWMMRIGGNRVRINAARRKDSILVAAGAASFEFKPAETQRKRARSGLASPLVEAPMPGRVLKILVEEGAKVSAGDALVVIEAMKMETTLYAEGAGMIAKVWVVDGQMVDHGATLIELSPLRDSSSGESLPPGR